MTDQGQHPSPQQPSHLYRQSKRVKAVTSNPLIFLDFQEAFFSKQLDYSFPTADLDVIDTLPGASFEVFLPKREGYATAPAKIISVLLVLAINQKMLFIMYM